MTMTIITNQKFTIMFASWQQALTALTALSGFYNAEVAIAKFLVCTHVVWATAEFLVSEVNG